MSTSNEQAEVKGNYDWMDRPRFLKMYKLKLEYEFSHSDDPAEWAQNGHRFWGKESGLIALEEGDPDKTGYLPRSSAALSPDNRYLAVSTNAVIRLYDIKSKTIVSELKGHDENVEQLYFAPLPSGNATGGVEAGYTLVSSGMHEWVEGRTYIWHLNESGTLLSKRVPNDVLRSLTKRAMKPIAQDLIQQHRMAFHELKGLRENMTAALQQAVSTTRAKELLMLRAQVPMFGFANPISRDGKRLITIEKNESTQSGLRSLEEMPRIVVRNIDTLSEEWRLTGHQDTITWAGWSPDDKWIAEASWDETFGIWNPKVKDRPEGHLLGPSGNQNWVGDFSADGKYVVFSGGSPTKVAIYDVETGEEVAELKHPGISTGVWVRQLKWSPIDYTIAVVVKQQVVLWHPLDNNTYATVLKIETDGTLLTTYNDLRLVKWVDEGQKLIVRDTANTIYMWDIRMNKKWRFQRPDGLALETNPIGVFFIKQWAREGAVLSLDGDGKVRYWNL